MVRMNDFQNKRIMVTGHTGFKGTWFCWLLSILGAKVFGYALPPSEKCLYRMAKPPLSGEFLADIRDGKALKNAITVFQPELVFHLAAHSYIDGSYTVPMEIFDINLMGTVRLLETIRSEKYRVPVVVVTSDKGYASQNQGCAYRETDSLGAAESYSTSKACQDLAAQCYRFSFPGMAVAVARASNTVGGGDFNQARLLPYLLDCFVQKKTAILRKPEAIRPWQYVLDVLWGYLCLGKALAENSSGIGAAYNFGPSPDGFRTVEHVATLLAHYFTGANYQWQEETHSSEMTVLRLDSSKAKQELNWVPLYSLEETLARTAHFHLGIQQSPAAFLCHKEVGQYLERVQKVNESYSEEHMIQKQKGGQ